VRYVASSWHQKLRIAYRRSSQPSIPKILFGMHDAPVARSTNQPVHAIRTFSSKQFVQVALTVSCADKLGFGTTGLERSKMIDAFNPLNAFLLFDRAHFGVRLLDELFFVAHPGLHAQHTQRQAIGGHGQQAVHDETALVTPGAVTQALCRGQMRQVEFSGVLHRQHNRYLPHAIQDLRNVRRQNSIGIDLRIVEEPVRRLKLCRLERLRKRSVRAEGKPTRQRNQTPRQARVAQIRFAELGACPIVRIAFANQSRLPPQNTMAEVDIAPSRLQAENPLFTHRDVGNPEVATPMLDWFHLAMKLHAVRTSMFASTFERDRRGGDPAAT
jgi:hypothetical protein